MQTEQTELTGAEAMFPASFAQQRMWFLERLEGGAAYNVPVATRLRGALDVDALEGALGRLIERHESLRTVFTLVDDIPHQVIRPARAFSLNVIDLSGAEGAEARALQIASHQARAGFDLAAEEPFRVVLVKLGDEDHLLSLTLHHIVTDAWSMGVLTRELGELYAGLHAGEAVELPELEIQYADYAVWQQQWLDGGGLDRQVDYWRKQLSGAPALLELPTDRPRPSRQSFRGDTRRVMLPLELMEQVRALGESTGATMFMTLLATFATLLSRYSGQQDVVVASPVANRSRTELERVIGLFVNTLPLRVELTGDPSFSELLHRTREVALAAFSHQDLPFEKIVENLAPERHRGHAPVAQVMLVVQSAPERPATLPGLEQERVLTERNTAKFDLTLFAAETPEGLRLSLEYCTDLFDESTAVRMLDHFRVLLEAAVADPDRSIAELELVTSEDSRRLVARAAKSEAFPIGCLHELFEAQVVRAPDATAVTFEGSALSYNELNERANRLAHRLRALGVREESLVALCLERSLDLVVAVLAVLKAGGAYVPLDPGYPAERLAFVLEDTAAPVLLTQEHLLERLPPHEAQVICLDSDAGALPDSPVENLERSSSPESAAYVIYTSGSTGRPKGVTVEHRNVARLFTATDRWFGFGPQDSWLLLHSYAFDFSVWELWGALLHGGRLVVVPYWATRSPSSLRELLVDERVTVLNATPSLFSAALDELVSAVDALSLRLVVFGGEALQPSALRPWFDRFGDREPRLVNMYGITETTVHVTYRPLTAADCDRDVSPIGEPIPDLQIYVLDARLKPVPEGVPGELFVGGAGVARGYLHRPELTAERFLPNPFGDGTLYRTGDRARQLRGELLYLGRIDDQVKIRGFRIELGEIEATLRRHQAVRDAVVVAREEDIGDKRLVAYVMADTPAPSAAELHALLRRTLPDFMIPSAFVALDAFPLTPNGKIDRKLLPAPDDLSRATTEYIPARTELERSLAEIWQQVLKVDSVGVHDDFFALGGHSLLAVRLFAEIERRLGARLPLSALFDTATIAGLAEIIELEGFEETEWSTLVRLRSGGGQLPLFLISWADGEVLPYRDLVKNLDLDLPVFGLQAPGTDRRTLPFGTIEELAAHYLEEIRRIQPHGPYRFGGFCFSGLVAYEMARQLEARGENTSTLALIEAYADRPRRRRRTLEARRAQLNAFREAGPVGRGEWLRSRIAGRVRRGVYFKGGPRLYELLTAHNLQRLIPHRRLNVVLIASNLARMRYVPKPSDVRVQFFRAQRAADPHPTPWDDLATRGVDVRPIVAPDIDHANMMYEPHVQILAEELMRHLNGGANGATSSTGAVSHRAD